MSNRQPGGAFFQDPIECLSRTAKRVRISLWMLKHSGENAVPQFVHGNAVSSRADRDKGKWFRNNVKNIRGGHKLVRYTIDLEPEQARQILTDIASGNPPGEAFSSANIFNDEVDTSNFPTNRLKSLPTIFLPTSPHSVVNSATHSPRTSPVKSHGCFCLRLAQSPRLSFMPGTLSEYDDTLREVCVLLSSETGLRFDMNSGDALGSLEVYFFPSLDGNERDKVAITFEHSPGHVISVRILSDLDDAQYAVHVRAEQTKDIVSDELKVMDHGVSSVAFDLPEPIDGARVQIWKRNDGAPWVLWHEYQGHFLREIHTNISIAGLSGSIDSSWLSRLPKRLGSRIESFKSIQQVSAALPSIVSNRQRWESEIQNTRRIVARANPPQSRSRFFKNWGGGKFEFAEWLKAELSEPNGVVVIIDPFFDVLGLDLVCRASGSAKEIVVVTCTQAKSLDDTGMTPRSERLRERADRYRNLLSGVKLRICDVRSKSSKSSKKQLFHDRYLLVFDNDDNVTSGFCLSTSLQSAATSSPLLVTEIPVDILDDVADYVTSLTDIQANAEYALDILFPDHQLATAGQQLDFSEDRAQSVMNVLVASGRAVSEGPSITALRLLNVYDGDRVRLEFSDSELHRIVLELQSQDVSKAALVWDGVIEAAIVGWSYGTPQLLQRMLNSSQSDDIKNFVSRYLEACAFGTLQHRLTSGDSRTISHVWDLPFDRCLDQAASFYDYYHSSSLTSGWPTRLAMMFLVLSGHEHLDRFVQSVRDARASARTAVAAHDLQGEERSGADRVDAALRELECIDALLSVATGTIVSVSQNDGPGLPDSYALSANAFTRSVWAISMWRSVARDDLLLQKFVTRIGVLSSAERRLFLAYIVYEMRIADNRRIEDEDRTSPRIPAWIVARCVEDASGPCDLDHLIRLVELWSGPSVGDWAYSTNREILGPLVDAIGSQRSVAFQVWNHVVDLRTKSKFASASDLELVQVWGMCAWSLDSTSRLQVVESLGDTFAKSSRFIQEPFSRNRNYERWSVAVNDVFWVLLRAWSIVVAQEATMDSVSARALLAQVCGFVVEEGLKSGALGAMENMLEHVLGEAADILS